MSSRTQGAVPRAGSPHLPLPLARDGWGDRRWPARELEEWSHGGGRRGVEDGGCSRVSVCSMPTKSSTPRPFLLTLKSPSSSPSNRWTHAARTVGSSGNWRGLRVRHRESILVAAGRQAGSAAPSHPLPPPLSSRALVGGDQGRRWRRRPVRRERWWSGRGERPTNRYSPSLPHFSPHGLPSIDSCRD